MEPKLKQKIRDIEAKFPGIRNRVRSYRDCGWGLNTTGMLEDIAYAETNRFQVVASKWEEHEWCDDGGGIEWKEWLRVYYKEKAGEVIRRIETKKVTTRDQHEPSKDLRYLWPYDFVSIRKLGGDRIKVAWANEAGEEGPSYKIKLK
ncbi:MAG: hypothetical protein NT076_01385 [Candidatus Pacearchaeota archaeon]|nr:hypothetical protein [Candidatus Pacearchaeota archaeon]